MLNKIWHLLLDMFLFEEGRERCYVCGGVGELYNLTHVPEGTKYETRKVCFKCDGKGFL